MFTNAYEDIFIIVLFGKIVELASLGFIHKTNYCDTI
jgi:hypothetical protein